ncbi:hypothetical protein HYW82_01255 [Candidatus Peregrinibacteria bacterium]|nr:hypothetical protein [Candidatus Peregrinibacteria bacterium]
MGKLKKLLVAAVLLLMLPITVRGEGYVKITRKPLTNEEIENIMRNGVAWLKNTQESDGHFRYEYIPFLDRYVDDDNMVRQTGAAFVLSEFLISRDGDLYDVKGNVDIALGYFEKNSMYGNVGGRQFRCVILVNEKCSLGATALALIAAINFDRADEEKYNSLIDDYLNFILAAKKNNGGFFDAYSVDPGFFGESAFSSGEALLALAKYYQMNGDVVVREIIDQSYKYFAKIYGDEPDNNFYLWGMAAVKILNEIEPGRSDYFNFVRKYTDWRIDGYRDKRATSHNMCAYIEGVVSAYPVLSDGLNENEKMELMEEIDFWLSKSADLQMKSGDLLWTKMKNRSPKVLKLKNESMAIGGFLTGLDEQAQRIDFTQHCISAFLQRM